MNKIGKNILLVDDMEMIRIPIVNQLTHAGHIVDEGINGVDAIKKAVNKQYDVIFMDIDMPELDGISATRILRQKGIQARIVGISAKDSYKNDSLDAGMNDFIIKPIFGQKLFNSINF